VRQLEVTIIILLLVLCQLRSLSGGLEEASFDLKCIKAWLYKQKKQRQDYRVEQQDLKKSQIA